MTIPFKDAIIIPQKATFEILDKKYVFVIDENNVVHQTEITVAAELPHLFVVSKGVSPKDKILLDGIRMVKNKEKINTEFAEPNEVISKLAVYAE
jgi:membrane fusion protein (multidrug efflux system)